MRPADMDDIQLASTIRPPMTLANLVFLFRAGLTTVVTSAEETVEAHPALAPRHVF